MSLEETLQRIHPAAVAIANEMERRAPELGVLGRRLRNGCRLIDAGIEAPGRGVGHDLDAARPTAIPAAHDGDATPQP